MTSPRKRALAGAVPDRCLNRPMRNHLYTSYRIEGPASSAGKREKSEPRDWPRWWEDNGEIVDLDARWTLTVQGEERDV
jgi:hypothetical protein